MSLNHDPAYCQCHGCREKRKAEAEQLRLRMHLPRVKIRTDHDFWVGVGVAALIGGLLGWSVWALSVFVAHLLHHTGVS